MKAGPTLFEDPGVSSPPTQPALVSQQTAANFIPREMCLPEESSPKRKILSHSDLPSFILRPSSADAILTIFHHLTSFGFLLLKSRQEGGKISSSSTFSGIEEDSASDIDQEKQQLWKKLCYITRNES